MSEIGLEGLDHTVQLTRIWINDLDKLVGWGNKSRSYRLLKAVLHAVRDWLPVNESADLAAQMPTLLRGVYYDQWRPAITPVKERGRTTFLARIEQSFAADPLENPTQAVMAVFQLLSNKISAGEISDVRHALQAELRNLWPEPDVAAGGVRS